MVVILTLLAILSLYAVDTTYYVSTKGTDSKACGNQTAPCASVGQVLINYPLGSYVIFIGTGNFITSSITLPKDAYLVLQGTNGTNLSFTGNDGSFFVTNSNTSTIEFRDLTLTLSGAAGFTTLQKNATVGLYNVPLVYSKYTANFTVLLGGSLIIINATFNDADFDSYFILDISPSDDSYVMINGSTFNNLHDRVDASFMTFFAFGEANIIVSSNTFTNMTADYGLFGFWSLSELSQAFVLTNNVFNGTTSYLPCVYIENFHKSIVSVQNNTWINSVASFVSGALEALGSQDGIDHNITLNALTFINCRGPYAGALLVGFNSLNLSDSVFGNNSATSKTDAFIANDLVHAVNSSSAKFGENITNSCSSTTSYQPRAVLWDVLNDGTTDISSNLPDCKSEEHVTSSFVPPLAHPVLLSASPFRGGGGRGRNRKEGRKD